MLRKMRLRQRFSLLVLTVALLVLSFHKINLWYLAWFSFVPFFFALKDLNYKKTLLIAYPAGLIFYLLTLIWLTYVTVAGWIALCAFLGLFFAIFGLAVKYSSRFFEKRPVLTVVSLAAFWVILEFIQGHIFTGFGWALLGYSQYKILSIIQIADLTGVYGISFLIMTVNICLWRFLAERRKVYIVSPFLILLIVQVYAIFIIAQDRRVTDVRLAVVQGNIPQTFYGKGLPDEIILDRYVTLTEQAAKENPNLIIWPETAVPGEVKNDVDLLEAVIVLTTQNKIPLLMGTITTREVLTNGNGSVGQEDRFYNSSALISENGGLVDFYRKTHLVPFGEFIPLATYFPFLRSLAPIGDFSRGEEFVVFNINGFKFSTLICFEDIFPAISRKFVRGGAQILINMTNDAWFRKTSAPYQHMANSVFRAVENRRPLVRAANTGISCFIDFYGKVRDTLSVRGEEALVEGFKVATVSIPQDNNFTFYTKYGDWFVIFCLLAALILPLLELKKRLTAKPGK